MWCVGALPCAEVRHLICILCSAQEEYEEDGILDDATEEVPLASEHYTAPSTTSPNPPPGKL